VFTEAVDEKKVWPFRLCKCDLLAPNESEQQKKVRLGQLKAKKRNEQGEE
jgi:hypothetical protein